MSVANPTRQRFIDIAFELFGRHGFHAIGLDRILAEVGVTKTTFYNHFESKDELVLAVIQYRHEVEMGLWKERLPRLGGLHPRGQLLAVFDALDEWFSQPDFRGCIFITAAAEFPSPHDPAHLAAAHHARQVLDLIRDLAHAAGARDPAALAAQLCLLIEGAIVIRHLTGDETATTRARQLADSLLRDQLPGAPEPTPCPPPN